MTVNKIKTLRPERLTYLLFLLIPITLTFIRFVGYFINEHSILKAAEYLLHKDPDFNKIIFLIILLFIIWLSSIKIEIYQDYFVIRMIFFKESIRYNEILDYFYGYDSSKAVIVFEMRNNKTIKYPIKSFSIKDLEFFENILESHNLTKKVYNLSLSDQSIPESIETLRNNPKLGRK